MRVLCSTTAGAGHFGPMVPVARACLEAGHEVRVAAPVSFAGDVEAAGLAHEPFDDVPPEVLGPIFGRLGQLSSEEANAVVMGEIFARHDARAALPGLGTVMRRWRPDVVLRDAAEFGSLATAVAAGVTHIEVSAGMASVMEWAHGHLLAPLAELDDLVGLPAGSLASSMVTAPRLTTVPALLDTDTCDDTDPRAGGGTRPTWRYRAPSVHVPGGRLPPPWGDPSLPLVYVTFGSVAGALGEFASVYPAALDAMADLPVRVLMTTGYAAAGAVAGRVPPNAHVEAWWPQDDIMPLAALVVGHGGFGTTMTALAAGVPQVVVPLFAFDQWINAERVTAFGAGVSLDSGPGVAGLGEAVLRVLGDSVAAGRARTVAREIASLPDVSGVVSVIEQWG
ncbi:MAG: glycosyltransferase [Humibacillus sp.]